MVHLLSCQHYCHYHYHSSNCYYYYYHYDYYHCQRVRHTSLISLTSSLPLPTKHPPLTPTYTPTSVTVTTPLSLLPKVSPYPHHYLSINYHFYHHNPWIYTLYTVPNTMTTSNITITTSTTSTTTHTTLPIHLFYHCSHTVCLHFSNPFP